MSNKKPDGTQIDAIDRNSPFIQLSFDLKRHDKFIASYGADFTHYKAMPSPIGKNDRGTYRRNDGVDTITSNGYIYTCAGKFTAQMGGSSRSQTRGAGGLLDPSQCLILLPRFYNKDKDSVVDGSRIYLMPGDRLYLSDPDVDVTVSTSHEMDFVSDQDNIPMFPIVCLELPLIDSRNTTYVQGTDFMITGDGNIRWIAGGKNPGIDPDTGKGRVYSIRYRYKGYWYVDTIPEEIRVTNVTNGTVRSPERMSYHAVLVREYVYHDQNRGDKANQLKSKDPKRVDAAPVEAQNPNKFVIPVDMSTIGDDEEQS